MTISCNSTAFLLSFNNMLISSTLVYTCYIRFQSCPRYDAFIGIRSQSETRILAIDPIGTIPELTKRRNKRLNRSFDPSYIKSSPTKFLANSSSRATGCASSAVCASPARSVAAPPLEKSTYEAKGDDGSPIERRNAMQARFALSLLGSYQDDVRRTSR
jgi:hypothetical protein